eukprot:3276840-Pleurochrysis_carterae.AAC.1
MGQGAPGKQRSSKSNQQEQPKSTTPGMVRVGINGFGRIGRLTFRYAWEMEGIEIVAVNEIVGGAETAAYLVQFDSVHGTWSRCQPASQAKQKALQFTVRVCSVQSFAHTAHHHPRAHTFSLLDGESAKF